MSSQDTKNKLTISNIVGTLTIASVLVTLFTAAIRAHEVTFENQGAIRVLADSVKRVHEESHNIMFTLDSLESALSEANCLTRLELTDSLFPPFVVSDRCPSN
jgi:hypothetical protein